MHGTRGILSAPEILQSAKFLLHRPMSQISAIFGTDDDQEILTSLYLIANVSEKSRGNGHLLTCSEHFGSRVNTRVSVHL